MLAKNGHKKESLDGTLPKKVLRLALVATCADAKSQLRNHNLNHLFDALMKRYKKSNYYYLGANIFNHFFPFFTAIQRTMLNMGHWYTN